MSAIGTAYIPGSPSDLNTGNGIEGAMVFHVFKSEGEPGTRRHIGRCIGKRPTFSEDFMISRPLI